MKGVTAEEFFPVNESFSKDIEKYKAIAKQQAEEKYGTNATKSVQDYIYKYHRAMYFRERSAKANKPHIQVLKQLLIFQLELSEIY